MVVSRFGWGKKKKIIFYFVKEPEYSMVFITKTDTNGLFLIFVLGLQKILVLCMNSQLIELYFVSKQLPAKSKLIQSTLNCTF